MAGDYMELRVGTINGATVSSVTGGGMTTWKRISPNGWASSDAESRP